MSPDEFKDFRELMQGVHDFYGRDVTEFALSVWWQAMRPFDLAAVRDAMSRHVVNPDAGQFMPKPADVVRMIGGRTVDAAQRAWSKVDAAVRRVGTYQSVAFDDPVIHRVIEDMGGWILLGGKSEHDWPFVAREFENRYRGYAMRNETPDYCARLVGIAESSNLRSALPVAEPVLIGDSDRARRVLLAGGVSTTAKVIPLGDAARRLSA